MPCSTCSPWVRAWIGARSDEGESLVGHRGYGPGKMVLWVHGVPHALHRAGSIIGDLGTSRQDVLRYLDKLDADIKLLGQDIQAIGPERWPAVYPNVAAPGDPTQFPDDPDELKKIGRFEELKTRYAVWRASFFVFSESYKNLGPYDAFKQFDATTLHQAEGYRKQLEDFRSEVLALTKELGTAPPSAPTSPVIDQTPDPNIAGAATDIAKTALFVGGAVVLGYLIVKGNHSA